MKPTYDILWKKYFQEPSLWWDNRRCKTGTSFPDFKHKVTKEALWLDNWNTPSWVAQELKQRELAQAQIDGAKEKDEVTEFLALLKTCTKHKDLQSGTKIHDDILRRGSLEKCLNALVTMYAKCGALMKAKELFDMHKSRDLLTWTALTAGYAQKGQGWEALNCLEQMRQEGFSPDQVTYICVLKACGSIKAVSKGEEIHHEIAKHGLLENNIVLANALVSMYAKCGALEKARQVLEQLPVRDVISWTSLMEGYTEQREGEKALACFESMQNEGLFPNAVTFICALKACGSLGAIDKGKEIHYEVAKQGLLGSNILLGTALVDMYAKCGALAKSRKVLEELPVRNVVTWNALIAGYAEHDKGDQALHCFELMQQEGLTPDVVTYTCILKACGSVRAIDRGEEFHDKIAQQGLLENNTLLGNALVNMYAKCGVLSKARRVFEELVARNVVSWTALIEGYTEHGKVEEAMDCLRQMQHEGISPNVVTFACILKSCGTIGEANKGEMIFDKFVKEQGLPANDIMLGTTLLNMYAKCGSLGKARHVLEQLRCRDVISWNALIAGYAEHGEAEHALDCFERMQGEGLSPQVVTFLCALKACASIGAIDKGEQIHDDIALQGLLGNNVALGTALVDMYAKSGALSKAHRVLERLPVRNVISWTVLIVGYAEHGNVPQTLNCLARMQHEDHLFPNAATLLSVINACNRVGQVEDAQNYFITMTRNYGLKPDVEHYTCLLDLFGHAGHLDKAIGVIEEMPCPDSAVWSALLDACQKWGDVEVGRWAFEHAVKADGMDAGVYTRMASLYRAAGMLSAAENIAAMRAGRSG